MNEDLFVHILEKLNVRLFRFFSLQYRFRAKQQRVVSQHVVESYHEIQSRFLSARRKIEDEWAIPSEV